MCTNNFLNDVVGYVLGEMVLFELGLSRLFCRRRPETWSILGETPK